MTAVEWLINEWLYLDQQFDMCLIDRNIYWDKLRQIQEQAKEMEKKQRCYSEEEVRDMLFMALYESQEECCTTPTKDSIVRKVLKTFKQEFKVNKL